jgi:hypothetical protein
MRFSRFVVPLCTFSGARLGPCGRLDPPRMRLSNEIRRGSMQKSAPKYDPRRPHLSSSSTRSPAAEWTSCFQPTGCHAKWVLADWAPLGSLPRARPVLGAAHRTWLRLWGLHLYPQTRERRQVKIQRMGQRQGVRHIADWLNSAQGSCPEAGTVRTEQTASSRRFSTAKLRRAAGHSQCRVRQGLAS